MSTREPGPASGSASESASGSTSEPGRFADGTTGGALVRIAGVLGLLVLVAVLVGALQANGWTTAWGFYGPLAGSGLIYCVVLWRGRHRGPAGPQTARDTERLLELLEQERVTPVEDRASRCTNDALFDVRDLAEHARECHLRGLGEPAAQDALAIEARARQEGWEPGSPLGRQVAVVAEAARRAQQRGGTRRRS